MKYYFTILVLLILVLPCIKAQEKIPPFQDSTAEHNSPSSSNSKLTDTELTRIKKQLAKAKGYLFQEHIDSTKLLITSLMEELTTKNLLNSPQGLETRMLEVGVLELNNARGKALEKIFSLIEDCKSQKEWRTLSWVYMVAELAYEFLNKPERCLYYFKECGKIIEAHNLEASYPLFYNRYSTYHQIWGDRDSSYFYAKAALRVSEVLYETQGEYGKGQRYEDVTNEYASANYILGGLYQSDGFIEEAKHHYEQAKLIWEKENSPYNRTWSNLHLSWFYADQKDYETALVYNDTSQIHGQPIYDNWGILGTELKSYVFLNRAEIFEAIGKWDSAYYFLNLGNQADKEVINARNHLHATEVEARHTDEQKAFKIEQQNEQLDKERTWRLGLIGVLAGFFLLATGLIYFYRQLRIANHKTKLQAEELQQLDKVKSNFFANISHELRTPLTLILGPLSYILDNPDEWKKEHIQRQLLVMQRNGKSLMELIEEILDLSKLEANKLELQEEGTPVVQFFEYLFFVFEPQFQSQDLNYELKLDVREDLHALLDRKKLEKVLNNFLSNAIKFTPKKGKITLSVKETTSQLKIQVSDTGKGIHPKDLPHIFERFYQSKQADQKLYGGTGIGLALVNEFAQLMGGKVSAESTLGTGSTFFFELPKKEVVQKQILASSATDLPEEEEIYAIGSDFTIMVVEDNQDMRAFIHQLLQKKYKKIYLAKNGAEGLALLKEHGTDIQLIVSDVMMPEVDGLTMLKQIKQNAAWSGIPVIMLTALAAERDKLTALTIGVDDYLTKPFSVPELLVRVQNLLFNYHQRQEWQNSKEFLEQQQEIQAKNTAHSEINIEDKKWVDELNKFVEESLSNVQLDVQLLASFVHLSPRQLNRKLKAITGLSPAKFIKEVRLQTARKTLEKGNVLSISEVAYNVGFKDYSTFSFVFKNRFGKSPKEYLR